MASTYPADVAEAAKWSRAHSEQKGDDAVKMVENEPWDPERAVAGRVPAGDHHDGREARLGEGSRRRVPRPARGRDGLGAAAARAGAEGRQPQDQRAGQGVDRDASTSGADRRAGAGDRDRAGAAAGRLRADLQPDRRVRRVAVPGVSAVLRPLPARILVLRGGRRPASPGAWASASRNALWGGCNWGRGDVNINVNRYNNINHQPARSTRTTTAGRTTSINRGNTPYRGGDQTRQNLQRKSQAANRDQYRGRDADRQRAAAVDAGSRHRRRQTARATARRALTAARRSSGRRAPTVARCRIARRTSIVARRSSARRASTAARTSSRARIATRRSRVSATARRGRK